MIRLFAILMVFLTAMPSTAQDLSALARLDGLSVEANEGGTVVALTLSQPVPWRAFLSDGPPKLVMDFNTLSVEGNVDMTALADLVEHGLAEDGWTRLVLRLPGPQVVDQAGMATEGDGSANLTATLVATDAETFAAAARPSSKAPSALPESPTPPVVVIDPGHGGLDPGAEVGSLNEKVLMLAVARELEEALINLSVY